MFRKILVTVSLITLMFSATGWATQLTITDVQHFPAPGSNDMDREEDLVALLVKV